MDLIKTGIDGLVIIKTNNFLDKRGVFRKVFNEEAFLKFGIDFKLKELYYSVNNANVVRGMHFQVPPADCDKIVWVSQGKIMDVVLDIREGSPTYGKYYAVELTQDNGLLVYIPSGFAHGFLSLEDCSIVNYAQGACYNPDCDCGIYYNSFGYDWPLDSPIISGRDSGFIPFKDFKTPFV